MGRKAFQERNCITRITETESSQLVEVSSSMLLEGRKAEKEKNERQIRIILWTATNIRV